MPLRVSVALAAFLVLSIAPSAAEMPAHDAAAAATEERSHDAPATHTGTRSHDATATHTFEDVEHWASVFDDPARDRWQKPKELVAALEIEPGMRVADVGAGTGYLSRHLSAAVGPTGAVLAVDTEPSLVEHLRRRAETEGLDNLSPILASPGNPRIPRGSVDLIVLLDTYHHIGDRLTYARSLRDPLAPDGRIAIVDWQKRELPVGPPDLDHKLAREHVVEEMREAGWALVAEPDVLPYQYFLVFRPDSGSGAGAAGTARPKK
jgi:ubiquinone/menaquinone biosynthesis C-methylase UbiE